MAMCPDGHQSGATDYCDVCGLSMGGPAPAAGTSGGGAAPPRASAAPSGEPCPNCLLPRTDDPFCEGCGYDFEHAAAVAPVTPVAPVVAPPATPAAPVTTAPPVAPPTASDPALAATLQNAVPNPAPVDPAVDPARVDPGLADPAVAATAQADPLDLDAELEKAIAEAAQAPGPGPAAAAAAAPDPAAAAAAPVTPQAASASAATGVTPQAASASAAGTGTGKWYAVAVADRGYYDSVVAEGEIDPNAYPFPPYCPERRFPVDGDTVRIGRSSKSRGTVVEIDLTGPPTDPGVSRLHAVLRARPDGGWEILDPGSVNGTMLNDDTAPIPENVPFEVGEGHRIHVGVWTTLTLVREP